MAAPRRTTSERSSSRGGTAANTAKKSTTKKTASAKKTASSKKTAPAKKVTAMQIGRTAAGQLAELTGRSAECVIGIERTDEGWRVDLEVVESRRIPDSTDILATYRVETDEDGELTGYHRVRRYVRGKGGDDDGGRR